jgi:histone arginine demethylase JMJD6
MTAWEAIMTDYPQVPRLYKPSAALVQDYVLAGKPVLIEGCTESWPARSIWTPQQMQRCYGHLEVKVRRCSASSEVSQLSLSDYISYALNANESDPYYLSNWKFEFDAPDLLQHYYPPEYFPSWHSQLPDNIRPVWRWLFIGPASSGTRMHVDVLMTSAWNAATWGRKRWLFWEPSQESLVYSGEVDGFHPDLVKFPKFAQACALECVQGPGDIVFTPTGWWHQVRNETFTISVTENFVNESNIHAVSKCLENPSEDMKRRYKLPDPAMLSQIIDRFIAQASQKPA